MTRDVQTTEGAPRTIVPMEITSVWKQVGPELAEELTEFWLEHGAISDPVEAKRRTQDVVCLSRDPDGNICAVGSVAITVLPRLLQPLYYYRTFLSPAVRGQNHTTLLYNRCRQVLQDYNLSLPQAESIGVLIELENASLEKRSIKAYIPEMNSVFIGYSPRGLHLRVAYFDDATLLPPMAPA